MMRMWVKSVVKLVVVNFTKFLELERRRSVPASSNNIRSIIIIFGGYHIGLTGENT